MSEPTQPSLKSVDSGASEALSIQQAGDAIIIDGRRFTLEPIDDNQTHFFNRELSWVSFNARVLALAADVRIPLLERVKFLAIYASNLDEFFQVRVAGIRDQIAANIRVSTADGRTPQEQLHDIRDAVRRFESLRQRLFDDYIVPQLKNQGVRLIQYEDLTVDDMRLADRHFDEQVFPILTPLAVDPGHPFPYISDLSLNLGVRVKRPQDDRRRFARIKVPDSLERLVPLSEAGTFMRVEDLIVAHLDQLFPGLEVVEHLLFRVTRNADLTYRDEEAEDLLELVEMELRRRRLGNAVRLEIGAGPGESIRALLRRELVVDEADVYEESSFLAMRDLMALTDIDRPDLAFKAFSPVVPARFSQRTGEEVDLFEEIRDGDLLVHHPFESFAASTQDFIRHAAQDRDVVAIKMTLYRTSTDSPIIRALVEAAEAGKQVAVLIELKARFDERTNIEWAKTLEQAGVHVTYGITGLKIHAKLTMVVRSEAGQMVRYCHFGTGNYNHGTARVYSDFGLFTASPELGDELAVLFNTLTGYGGDISYDDLLVAPHGLRSGLEALVRGEMTSENGRIVLKMNSLVDPKTIALLYEASQAGVRIDCIVRGICCLRPQVPGLSDNIAVRSIVGRYLEHARLYYFANGSGPGRAKVFMGSADLMERNLDHRVETLVGVSDPAIEDRIGEALELELQDSIQAWTLTGDGAWTRNAQDGLLDLHAAFEQSAKDRRRSSLSGQSS